MPPEVHFPSCFPRQGCVSSSGAVSAKAPHATHQKVGSLTTMQCLRAGVPLASDNSLALSLHDAVALPWQDRGASLLQVKDLILHSVHHHPATRRCSLRPPSLGFPATMVLRLPVWGLTSVGRAGSVCCFGRLLAAAAAAALARDAWVSLCGSPAC